MIIEFVGRRSSAIGIFHPINLEIPDGLDAHEMLMHVYKTHDPDWTNSLPAIIAKARYMEGLDRGE